MNSEPRTRGFYRSFAVNTVETAAAHGAQYTDPLMTSRVLAGSMACCLAAAGAMAAEPEAVDCPARAGDPARLALPTLDGSWLDTGAGEGADGPGAGSPPARGWIVEILDSTCGEPCQSQHQALRRLDKRFRALHLRFVSLWRGAEADPFSAAWMADPPPWPLLLDRDRRCALEAPSLFVIDARGRSVYLRGGLLDEESLAAALVKMR